jgi:thiamine-phosphate pyrophosphorylase
MGVLRGLYAVTPDRWNAAASQVPPLADLVAQAIRGGARMIQYRDKGTDWRHRLAEAGELAELCRPLEVPLIVNDDPGLAQAVGASGVHLGRDDAWPLEARARLGPDAILGVSCYDRLDLAVSAERAGADYVAFGSFFPSSTKPGAVRAPLRLLAEARSRLRIPIVAIGGITPENGGPLIAAGADLLAVVAGLFGAPDIAAAARSYADLFERGPDPAEHTR